MKIINKYILLLISVFVAVNLFAQSADMFFVNGANFYVDDKLQQAAQVVEEGMSQFPNDEKLQALMEKIKQEQEKQEQEQKNQQQQQQNQEQQDQEQNQEQQQPQNQDQQQEDQQDQSQNQQNEQNQEQETQQQEQQQPVMISPEDAERLLEALEDDEKELQKRLMEQKAKNNKVRTEKNW